MDKNDCILKLVETLKGIINRIYENCNVDMTLLQPGMEPLSMIGKTEVEILTELKANLLIILSRFSKTKKTNMRNIVCQNFFGLENDALIKLAERITALMPVINCSKNDEEFANMPFVKESNKFVEKNLNEICINMLFGYLKESIILITDYQDYAYSDIETEEDWKVSAPQTLSNLFRIFYEGDKQCYCTIADAIRSNQETLVP